MPPGPGRWAGSLLATIFLLLLWHTKFDFYGDLDLIRDLGKFHIAISNKELPSKAAILHFEYGRRGTVFDGS